MTPLMLLVGLGNPGSKYDGTRHNVGFMALDRLAAAAGGSFRANAKLHGDLADIGQGDRRLRLLKPQTFMNDSGRAIRASLDWFGWTPEQLLVIVDDMDLPLGRLRLRLSGGAGGTTACAAPLPTWAAKPLQGCGLALALQAPTAKSASSARLGTCSATSKAGNILCWIRCCRRWSTASA